MNKDKKLKKKIDKTREKLASVTQKLNKLEIKQARRAAKAIAREDGNVVTPIQ